MRAADINVYLHLTRQEISCKLRERFVARCTTGPRRAYYRNHRSVDRRDAPLGLAELGRVDIVNQVRGLIRNQRINYIGIIDFKNPTAYSYNKNV